MRVATLFALAGLLLLTPAGPSAPSVPPPSDTPLDRSVAQALAFLNQSQDARDGSWRLNGTPNVAVTSLAVMAFLSAGHVPGEGRYGPTVEKGVRYALKCQNDTGLIANQGGVEMYHHGISTLMLCEVAGMVDGPLAKEVRLAVQKAVPVILQAQRTAGVDRGGWRYQVAHFSGSDLSVTGWQLMALRAARNLGCDVPAEVIDRAVDYVKRCQDAGSGGFAYTPYGGGPTVACTGTGILALELCGKDRHHSPEALRAGGHLLKNPPTPMLPHFSYTIYYCSQAAFQLGDNYWNHFRPKLHDVLLKNQRPDGSWVGGGFDTGFGPDYSTAMAVLALTVEYRFLPIYQRDEGPPKEKP